MEKSLFVLKKSLYDDSAYRDMDFQKVFHIHKIYSNFEEARSSQIKLDIDIISRNSVKLQYYFKCSQKEFYAFSLDYMKKTFDIDFEMFVNNLEIRDKISENAHNYLIYTLAAPCLVNFLCETDKFKDYLALCFENKNFRSPHYEMIAVNGTTCFYQICKNPLFSDFRVPQYDYAVEYKLFASGVFFENRQEAFKVAAQFVGYSLQDTRHVFKGSFNEISHKPDELRDFLDKSEYFYFDKVDKKLGHKWQRDSWLPPEFFEELYSLFNYLCDSKQPFTIKKVFVNDIYSETILDKTISDYWIRVLDLPF
jgi:hypothetical protein